MPKRIVQNDIYSLSFDGAVVGYRIKVVLDDGKIEWFDIESQAIPQEYASVLPSLVIGVEQLLSIGDKFVTSEEIEGSIKVRDISGNALKVKPIVAYAVRMRQLSRSFKAMGGNPDFTKNETSQFDRLRPLRGKHIFTKTYGDGEIGDIIRKNDLSGLWVYFFTNADDVPADKNANGEVKLDALEFLADIEAVRDMS